MKIYNDADARSTTVVTTKIDIGLEADMIAGAKRSLAECLGSDKIHSEALHDDIYTGNQDSLELARKKVTIPALQTKFEKLERRITNQSANRTDGREALPLSS